MNEHVKLDLPPELIDAVARRAAELVRADDHERPEPWLNVEQAAAHLACPKSRLYALVSKRAIRFHKDGSRLLFKCSELDQFVRNGGARR